MVVRRKFLKLSLAISALFAVPAHADVVAEKAETLLKGKTVRVIVPYAPGGSTDAIARRFAHDMSEMFDTNAIVENRSGGSSIIAVRALLSAPADGLTLFISESSPISVNPKIFKDLPYDAQKDLLPVGTLASYPFLILVNPEAPYNNLQEFVGAIKKSPGSIVYGTSGNGTLDHIAGTLLAEAANIELSNVAYKGAGPAMNDLMGGNIQAMFTDLPSGLPFAQTNRLKPIATTGKARAALLPDVGTVIEAGYPNYTFFGSFGVYANGKTDPQTARALNYAVNQTLRAPSMQAWLKDRNFDSFPTTMQEHRAYLDKEVSLYADILDHLDLPKN